MAGGKKAKTWGPGPVKWDNRDEAFDQAYPSPDKAQGGPPRGRSRGRNQTAEKLFASTPERVKCPSGPWGGPFRGAYRANARRLFHFHPGLLYPFPHCLHVHAVSGGGRGNRSVGLNTGEDFFVGAGGAFSYPGTRRLLGGAAVSRHSKDGVLGQHTNIIGGRGRALFRGARAGGPRGKAKTT